MSQVSAASTGDQRSDGVRWSARARATALRLCRGAVGLYHLAWEVGTLADLADTREKLVQAGALVGESDHRVSKSLYAKDPSGIEFEVMWRVPAQDWAAELADGEMILPLDLDAAIARWGQDQATGAAAGSPT